jgi:GNAT superfamily N-acetyltransferase
MADPLAPQTSDDALKPGDWIGADIDPNNPVLPGPPQRPSRLQAFEAVSQPLREYFMPAESLRYPDTPEARRAYDEAWQRARTAGGGRLPPIPGSPVLPEDDAFLIDLLANVGPKGLAALKFLRPAGKATDALRPEARLLPQIAKAATRPAVGAGEQAITDTLNRMAEAGRGNAWISVPEGGQGLYVRVNRGGVEIANADFEKKGTGAFTRYLDHIEKEAERLGLRSVTMENIFNERLIPFYQKRGYEMQHSYGGPPIMVKRIIPTTPEGYIDIDRYYRR